MKEPDWSLYRTFLAVAKTGSLSGAARAMGLTQPTVARHIEQLEADLGVALFLRSRRGLAMSDFAHALTPHAEAIAAASSSLMRAAAGARGEVRGVVRVSAGELMGVMRLPPILARLRRAWPDLEVQLSISGDLEDLTRRQADVAIRQAAPSQGVLVARKLKPTKLSLHASRDYLERHGAPRSIADLATHDLIGPETWSPGKRAVLAGAAVADDLSFVLRTDSDLAQFAAIRAGVGIGLTHLSLAARYPEMVPVLTEVLSPELPLSIVMHEDMRSSPACRAVFDALAEGLAD